MRRVWRSGSLAFAALSFAGQQAAAAGYSAEVSGFGSWSYPLGVDPSRPYDAALEIGTHYESGTTTVSRRTGAGVECSWTLAHPAAAVGGGLNETSISTLTTNIGVGTPAWLLFAFRVGTRDTPLHDDRWEVFGRRHDAWRDSCADDGWVAWQRFDYDGASMLPNRGVDSAPIAVDVPPFPLGVPGAGWSYVIATVIHDVGTSGGNLSYMSIDPYGTVVPGSDGRTWRVGFDCHPTSDYCVGRPAAAYFDGRVFVAVNGGPSSGGVFLMTATPSPGDPSVLVFDQSYGLRGFPQPAGDHIATTAPALLPSKDGNTLRLFTSLWNHGTRDSSGAFTFWSETYFALSEHALGTSTYLWSAWRDIGRPNSTSMYNFSNLPSAGRVGYDGSPLIVSGVWFNGPVRQWFLPEPFPGHWE